MKTYVLVLFLTIGCVTAILAQKRSFHFGVEGAGIAAVTNDSPWQMGAGSYLGIWGDFKLDHFTRLRFSMGYRHIGGYQRMDVVVTERFFPAEYQQRMSTTVLENMNHLQWGVSWQRRRNSSSPWSYSIGAYASLLTAVEGGVSIYEWGAGQLLSTFNNNSTFTDFRRIGTVSGAGALFVKEFPRLDVGLTAGLQYQITEGLWLNAKLIQGLRNQLPSSEDRPVQRHYLTALVVGFSAQIK